MRRWHPIRTCLTVRSCHRISLTQGNRLEGLGSFPNPRANSKRSTCRTGSLTLRKRSVDSLTEWGLKNQFFNQATGQGVSSQLIRLNSADQFSASKAQRGFGNRLASENQYFNQQQAGSLMSLQIRPQFSGSVRSAAGAAGFPESEWTNQQLLGQRDQFGAQQNQQQFQNQFANQQMNGPKRSDSWRISTGTTSSTRI